MIGQMGRTRGIADTDADLPRRNPLQKMVEPFEGPIDLTLPEPVTLADFAASSSEIGGRRIERVVVDDEKWVADADTVTVH